MVALVRRLTFRLTPRVTCGPRRARALRAPVRVPGGIETSKARDRPYRQVDALVRLPAITCGLHLRPLVLSEVLLVQASLEYRLHRCKVACRYSDRRETSRSDRRLECSCTRLGRSEESICSRLTLTTAPKNQFDSRYWLVRMM